jgi:hypothetical protein
MPFAARISGIPGVSDRALQQRAAQPLTGDRQFADQLLARSQGLLTNHSQEWTRIIHKNGSATALNVNSNSVRPCSFPHTSRFWETAKAIQFYAGK